METPGCKQILSAVRLDVLHSRLCGLTQFVFALLGPPLSEACCYVERKLMPLPNHY